MKRLTRIFVIGILLMLATAGLQAQVVGGYHCATDTSRAAWVDIGDNPNTTNFGRPIHLPFPFMFMGYRYDALRFDNHGVLHWGRDDAASILCYGNVLVPNPVVLMPYSVRWAVLGQEGNREVVFQVTLVLEQFENFPDYSRTFQVRLSEADGRITVQYKPKSDPGSTRGQLTLSVADVDAISTDGTNFNNSFYTYFAWPQNYRYYQFTPTSIPSCGGVGNLEADTENDSYLTLHWSPIGNGTRYRVEYREDGDPAFMSLTTTDTFAVISGLTGGGICHCKVTSICTNGQEGRPAMLEAHCPCYGGGNSLRYWDLADSNVTCYKGTVADPLDSIRIVDLGPDDATSRHTVHINRDITDPNTDNLLHTVPNGFCCSVRLGNKMAGAEAEAIAYTIDVDTNNISLILLTYAIVSQDPGHDEQNQPRFELKITDNNNNVINSCYDISFVSGSNDSCWHFCNTCTSPVNWIDWQVLGLNVSEMHGQQIKITFYNYDCTAGAHYGYAYFAMKTIGKEITVDACGEIGTSTLRAPQGLNYKWFSADDPSTTLGTTQAITINGGGRYYCKCIFPRDTSCSFLLYADITPQYPKAAFSFDTTRVDDCNYTVKFHNHSVIATDSNLTQLTNRPCQSHSWTFDDGSISVEHSPTHTFHPGTHWAELRASLSGDNCSNTIRHTFEIPYTYDTLTDSLCDGGTYHFKGQSFTEIGTHTVQDQCTEYTLTLTPYHYSHHEIEDTICQGDTYRIGSQSFATEGYHTATLTASNGCDSTFGISLTLRPLPSSDYNLYNTCREEAYYYYKCHLEPADSAYQVPGAQTYMTQDSTIIRWQPTAEGAPMPYFGSDSLLRIDADSAYTYYIYYAYLDSPQCPVTDTFNARPADEIVARMDARPDHLTMEYLDFTVRDISLYATGRKWIVDGTMLADTTGTISSTASADADSVVVSLIAFNRSCEDTATLAIPVLRYQLLFPNIFTPNRSANNTFGPSQHNVFDYELWIYDRRGHIVFHTTDINQPWNGTTHNGTACRQDTYVYFCTYSSPGYGPNKQVGTVTLLR